MQFKQRSHMAGDLRISDVGARVVINGWVDGNRDLGGLLFFDLRDRTGKIQGVVEPGSNQELYTRAASLRAEFVVSAEGVVRERENKNPRMPTGEVEILVDTLTILTESSVPPFEIKDEVTANEDLRLKYRFLDLRRPRLQQNLVIRHKITQSLRRYFDQRGFIEIETPILMKATPEGARDFLVPSRLHKGTFYALPQSPQLYKQLLMVAGMDRYFQIAKCFRDENLRADRQPEFTQVDVEMSFPTEEVVYDIMERALLQVWKDVGLELPSPFPRLTYSEAMLRFGSDKPDLRYALELTTLTDVIRGNAEFKPFDDALAKRFGAIGGLRVPGGAEWSRKQTDALDW
jgi:aspartyl-tRNA synthetase